MWKRKHHADTHTYADVNSRTNASYHERDTDNSARGKPRGK
jgi:hypothetical protein